MQESAGVMHVVAASGNHLYMHGWTHLLHSVKPKKKQRKEEAEKGAAQAGGVIKEASLLE